MELENVNAIENIDDEYVAKTLFESDDIRDILDNADEIINNECNCEKPEIFQDGPYYICMRCKKITGQHFDDNIIPSDNLSLSTLAPTMSAKDSVKFKNKILNTKNQWDQMPYREKILTKLYDEVATLVKAYWNKISCQRGCRYYLDSDITKESIELFGKITVQKITRNPIKMGVLANCYRITAKNNAYIYLNKSELAEMFGIKVKIVSEGNKIINDLIIHNMDISKIVNQTPFRLTDYNISMKFYFPQLTEEEIDMISKFINRIKDSPLVYGSTPVSLFACIVYCIGTVYKISVNELFVREALKISASTLNSYKNLLLPIINH